MLGNGRDHDIALEVEHEELLGVRGLGDDEREELLRGVVRRGALESVLGKQVGYPLVQRIEHVVAGFVSTHEPRHEHDVAPLLVDPAIERGGLALGGGVQPVEYGSLERGTRALVGDDAHDRHGQHGQNEEREHQPDHQAPTSPSRPCLRCAHPVRAPVPRSSGRTRPPRSRSPGLRTRRELPQRTVPCGLGRAR